MRRFQTFSLVVLLAVLGGVCVAWIHAGIFRTAVSVDATPLDESALPPFGEYTADRDAIDAFIQTRTEPWSFCNITNAVAELSDRMLGAVLKVGTEEYRYEEIRNGHAVRFKDVEKQITLGLLNSTTCDIKTIVIVKRGDALLSDATVEIEPRRRANGIEWNSWATEYTVTKPEGYEVVAVLYPHIQGDTVVPIFYTPYSALLHTPAFVERGVTYLTNLVQAAADELRSLQVPSKAFPGTFVADHPIYTEIAMRLDANEHMDPGEFLLDQQFTADRIHIIIGMNQEETARYTCSSADACGIGQFTEPTYQDMRQNYPAAHLMADSLEGRRDHLNVTKAQLLLLDSNMASFIRAFGSDIATDPWVVEGLVAAYNTGAARVMNVRSIAVQSHATEWTEARGKCSRWNKYAECLLDETKWYIAKERYLREEWNRLEGAAFGAEVSVHE